MTPGDLFAAYADTLDDGPLEIWPTFFTEHATYKIVARENHVRGLPLALMLCESRAMMEDRVRAIQELSMYAPRVMRHVISSVREPEPDRIMATYAVFETPPEGDTRVFSTGRYLGHLAREGGGARFSELTVVYDTALIPTSLISPL
ncbi:MAG TPA: aromatic-ring-hydroxylating dioxygenase subunit beta [Acidimicrobiales bacterium]|nr:aromatic-ring-hydroxylating dioxygenase subunit beta [Acidimicrobiales bacterium]